MRSVCIHGHFYQPPRESPWTGEIPVQPDAAPYADWNELIHAECYAPNALAPIFGPDGSVVDAFSTYSRMSMDFGPTLLAWLERRRPDTYRAVLAADRESRERSSGHGGAMAHPYGHTILPLDSARDRRTHVRWGARDFEHRFGRKPEGMWLPETAVDVPTLEALVDQDIRFTVLAPHQGARSRASSRAAWEPGIDGSVGHVQKLPSGRDIRLFFFDGSLSHRIAFGDDLSNGEALAATLASAVGPGGLAHVAVDGETFGHHKKFGELGLARALYSLGRRHDVQLTTYAAFAAASSSPREVEIAERTSWSCAHGVERWRADCGCRGGAREGASQRWRSLLREALNDLRDAIGDGYEREAGALVRDPWALRDDFVEVLLDASAARAVFDRHARRRLAGAEDDRLAGLLELQRQTLLMFTSCGWFFDDPADHATVQILRHARRAVELARDLLGQDLESILRPRLSRAKSVDARVHDAWHVYCTLAGPEGERRERGT